MKSEPFLFPLATSYPRFFNTNLTDPNRVIKLVEGKFCGIRVFYYQLFKLIFQIQAGDNQQQQELNYLQLLVNKVSEINSQQGTSNNTYLKKNLEIIETFLNDFLNQQTVHFQQFIDSNKQVDEALITFFRQLLKQASIQNGSIEQIFNYLSMIFKERVTQIGKCIIFKEPDVYVYVQSQMQLYLAFRNLEMQQLPLQNSIDKEIELSNKKDKNKNTKKGGKANDTIINIFGDMLLSSKHEGDSKFSNSFLTNQLNSSLSPPKKDESILAGKNAVKNEQLNNDFEKVDSKLYHFENSNVQGDEKNFQYQQISKKSNANLKTNDDSKFIKKSSLAIIQAQQDTIKKKQEKDISPQGRQFYRPYKLSGLGTISEVSKQSFYCSNRPLVQQPFDYGNQTQKGTFYKQFTNTKILNILPESVRSNVKRIKNKFMGVRAREKRQ